MPTINQIFGNKTSARILRILFSTPGKMINPDELARLAKSGRGNSYRALSELAKAGLLKKEKGGKTIFYSLNKASPFYEPLRGVFDAEKKTVTGHWNKINAIDDLVEGLKKAKLGDFSVTLFGSVARGTDTPKSDIDILVETDEKNTKRVMDIAAGIRKRHGLPVSATTGMLEELKTKNRGLFENIVREGVKIYG